MIVVECSNYETKAGTYMTKHGYATEVGFCSCFLANVLCSLITMGCCYVSHADRIKLHKGVCRGQSLTWTAWASRKNGNRYWTPQP